MSLARYLLLVPLAFAAACISAGVTVALGVVGSSDGSLVDVALASAIYAALLMTMPMLVVIFIAEAVRIQSLLFWLAVGGMAGLVAQIGDAVRAEPSLTGARHLLLVIAGLVGGAVYWLIAGHGSGMPRAGTRPR